MDELLNDFLFHVLSLYIIYKAHGNVRLYEAIRAEEDNKEKKMLK